MIVLAKVTFASFILGAWFAALYYDEVPRVKFTYEELGATRCMDEGFTGSCYSTAVLVKNPRMTPVVVTVDCGFKTAIELDTPARTNAMHFLVSETKPKACKLVRWRPSKEQVAPE